MINPIPAQNVNYYPGVYMQPQQNNLQQFLSEVQNEIAYNLAEKKVEMLSNLISAKDTTPEQAQSLLPMLNQAKLNLRNCIRNLQMYKI